MLDREWQFCLSPNEIKAGFTWSALSLWWNPHLFPAMCCFTGAAQLVPLPSLKGSVILWNSGLLFLCVLSVLLSLPPSSAWSRGDVSLFFHPEFPCRDYSLPNTVTNCNILEDSAKKWGEDLQNLILKFSVCSVGVGFLSCIWAWPSFVTSRPPPLSRFAVFSMFHSRLLGHALLGLIHHHWSAGWREEE